MAKGAPACAIKQRFAALIHMADFPCYMTPECVTATLMTKAVALNPDRLGASRASASGTRPCGRAGVICQYASRRLRPLPRRVLRENDNISSP